MRLVVARCTVDYTGRLDAHLPEAVRLVMVKADGCVAVHADGGAYKSLNWMNAPNTLVDLGDRWVVTNPKGETLTIAFGEVLADDRHELGADPGLQKDGVEAHLQELLAAAPPTIEPRLRLGRPGAATATARSSPSRSSAAARSTASSSWPGTSSGCTSTPRWARCAACSSPRS